MAGGAGKAIKNEIESGVGVARAYYERSSYDEKKAAREFFGQFDANGDGNISFSEFIKYKELLTTSEALKLFRRFDSNGDGVLNFDECLIFYYIAKRKLRCFGCDGCEELLWGSFFSCSLCVSGYPQTFELCSDCYRGGKVEHKHAYYDLWHCNTLLFQLMHAQAEKEREGGPSSVGRAYYSSGDLKAVRELFDGLDANGDGNISLAEFKNYLETDEEEKWFQIFDFNGDGVINFKEILMGTTMLSCDGCEEPLRGSFFSCSLCVIRHPKTFDLCCDCYRCGKVEHEHPYSNFLHNQALLLQLMQTRAAELRVEGHSASVTPARSKKPKEEMDSMKTKLEVADFIKKLVEVAKEFAGSPVGTTTIQEYGPPIVQAMTTSGCTIS